MFMFKRRPKQAASSELQEAIASLKRSGYAVGSPVASLTGWMWVMVGGKLYWEEQAIEMAMSPHSSELKTLVVE